MTVAFFDRLFSRRRERRDKARTTAEGCIQFTAVGRTISLERG